MIRIKTSHSQGMFIFSHHYIKERKSAQGTAQTTLRPNFYSYPTDVLSYLGYSAWEKYPGFSDYRVEGCICFEHKTYPVFLRSSVDRRACFQEFFHVCEFMQVTININKFSSETLHESQPMTLNTTLKTSHF